MKDKISSVATLIFLIFVGVLLISYVAQAMLGGADRLTPQAQKAYDSAQMTACETEKALAQAKLMDYLHGFIDLSEEDVVRLNKKKRMECGFQ
jgi:hypothetical protein